MTIGVMFLQLLFIGCLIFAGAMTNDVCKYSVNYSLDALDYRLPSEVVPRHYSIELIHTDDTFHGQSSTIVEVIRGTATITFHAYKLRIYHHTISLLKHERGNNGQHASVKWINHCNQTQTYVLKFHEELSPGFYTLSMRFRGHPHSSQGFVINKVNSMIDSKLSYITQFEPVGARLMFPCWDEPRFKATFNISVEHSFKVQAFSNMPSKKKTTLMEQEIMLTTFELTPVMSTYLVTIAITESTLDFASNDNVEVWFTRPLERRTDIVHRIANLADSFLTNYTDDLWEGWTISILTYPNFPSHAVGGWRFAAFRETDLLYNPNVDFSGRKLKVWNTVASQLTQQSIESFVSPMEWSHQWLSHAFAKYLSYKILGKEYNKDIMMQLFVVQIQQPAMHNDKEMKVPSIIHKYDPIYSSLIYKKASAFIRMIEHIVTEEVLQQTVAKYLKTYAYGSATPSDFLRILESEMHRLQIIRDCNISDVMHTWLSQRHYPTVLILQNQDGTILSAVPFEPKASRKEGENIESQLLVPVTFVTENQHPSTENLPIFWLNSTQEHNDFVDFYEVQPEECRIFNKQQFGYYRVNYEYEYWKKIVDCLNNKDHTKIHVLNRAQIIDDAYHFVIWGELSYELFYKLTNYLREETNFIVWHTMMNALHYMSPFFNYPESERFKTHMLNIMGNVLTTIGYDESPRDDDMLKAMRLLLLNWACKHGHIECRRRAHKKLIAHLDNPENNIILPGWKDWTYCAGLMDADQYIWHKFYINHIHNKKILKHLTCVDDDQLIQELIGLATFEHHGIWTELGTLRLRKLYHNLVKKHARKSAVLYFILKNFDKIINGRMTKMEGIVNLIMSVYSKYDVIKIRKYVENKFNWNVLEKIKVKYLTRFRIRQIKKQKNVFVSCFNDNELTDKND